MLEWYPLIKSLHIIFFTCWFAGLFYLPRLFVNLAAVKDADTYQQLVTMAEKLYRFTSPFMKLTIVLGCAMLYLMPGWLNILWLQIKLSLVVLLVIYHWQMGRYLKEFKANQSIKSHVFFRWFNEFPVILLFSIVILAITKPFI